MSDTQQITSHNLKYTFYCAYTDACVFYNYILHAFFTDVLNLELSGPIHLLQIKMNSRTLHKILQEM